MSKTTHVVIEFDRDYRVVTDTEFMDFPSNEDADKYARDKSWSGYTYYAMTWERCFRR